MKTLIVEDDFICRMMLQDFLCDFGPAHVAVNGMEALAAVDRALAMDEPYDLICLDIMMPEMDGQQALREIRAVEESHGCGAGLGAKILMTTSLSDRTNVMRAFREQCDGYLFKPIERAKLFESLRQFRLTCNLSISA